MHEEELLSTNSVKGVAAIASSFIIESIEHMVPWLMIMAAIIICDLASGIRRSMAEGKEIRLSRAFRETMGKMVTYFSFVVMVCMINIATHNKYNIDIYSCMFVCLIEIGSIFSNILKPKGITLNLNRVVELFFKKVTGLKEEDVEKVFEKEEREGEQR